LTRPNRLRTRTAVPTMSGPTRDPFLMSGFP
jgi:hypothetical protein